MRIRWIGPAIPLLVVLSFISFDEIWTIAETKSVFSKYYSIGFDFFVAAMFAMNGGYIFDLYKRVDPVPFITGKVLRDEYIQKHRPEYAAYQYSNRNLPENAKVFGLLWETGDIIATDRC